MSPSVDFVTQVTRVQRHLHSFILSMVWHPADADEVLQETNLALWEKAGEFDSSRPFLPWAMRFAQWQAMAWLKRRRREKERFAIGEDILKLIADESVADEPGFEARRRAQAKCLQKLRPEQRELVARRYEPDGSVQALARAAGTTPKAVSDRLRRIRQALLDCIQMTLAREASA